MAKKQQALIEAIDFSEDEYDELYAHIESRRLKNMHIRQPRTRAGKRGLGYLHAIAIGPDGRLQGRVSGPTLNVHYELLEGGKARFILFSWTDRSEAKMFLSRFGRRVLARAREERDRPTDVSPRPKYAKGEFYLRRAEHGGPASQRASQRAVESEQLSKDFCDALSQLRLVLHSPEPEPEPEPSAG